METLSIVIPVFNEVQTIKEIIERVREVHLPQVARREIVIVDDSSTDGTRNVLVTYKDPGEMIRRIRIEEDGFILNRR